MNAETLSGLFLQLSDEEKEKLGNMLATWAEPNNSRSSSREPR